MQLYCLTTGLDCFPNLFHLTQAELSMVGAPSFLLAPIAAYFKELQALSGQ